MEFKVLNQDKKCLKVETSICQCDTQKKYKPVLNFKQDVGNSGCMVIFYLQIQLE